MSRSRRQFLEHSMWTTASIFAASQMARPALAFQDEKKASPNDRLRVAIVGVNGRGGSHVSQFGKHPKTEITHVCDIDESVGNRVIEGIAEKQGKKPNYVKDIRKLMEEKSVDIVTIATPNHWHSLAGIWAIQAGKDVYVEKPVSHNVFEGRQFVTAARKHKKIVQTGTQCRSNPGMRAAMEYIHKGGIGEVKIARGLCYKRRNAIGPKGTYEVPKNVDYDLWLGPAPMAPLTRPKFHYDWHWQWAYGNGDLGNQGIHQMDLCRWALQKNALSDRVLSYGGRFGYEDAGETANTQLVIHTYGKQQLVFEVRGLETKPFMGASVGIIIEGTDGYVVMTSYDSGIAFDPQGKEVKKFSGGSDDYHFKNFVDAVVARDHKILNADIEEGHYSSALCHTGNISYRLGKQVPAAEVGNYLKDLTGPDDASETLERTLNHLKDNKVDTSKLMVQVGSNLPFDAAKEEFVGNADANAMLTREYRAPYIVPKTADL